jgi:molecular chaperone GrpE (heat shock protein)
MTREARIAELEAENAALRAQVSELPLLRAQVEALAAQVRDLQARAAKDSQNSGKPVCRVFVPQLLEFPTSCASIAYGED